MTEMRPKLLTKLGRRTLAGVALLVATAVPAVTLQAQTAAACPIFGCDRPGTPNETWTESPVRLPVGNPSMECWHQLAGCGSAPDPSGLKLGWTNTAREQVSFEIHRRENNVDIAKDVKTGLTSLVPGSGFCWPDVLCMYGVEVIATDPDVVTGANSHYTYIFSGLPASSDECVKVRARSADNDMVSDWSNEICLTVPDPIAPSFPQGATPPNPNPPAGPEKLTGSFGDQGVDLSWTTGQEASPTFFRIYRDGQAVGGAPPVAANATSAITGYGCGGGLAPMPCLSTTYEFAYTDMFKYSRLHTYAYKVCPVFGTEIQTEGTCSTTASVGVAITPVPNPRGVPAINPQKP